MAISLQPPSPRERHLLDEDDNIPGTQAPPPPAPDEPNPGPDSPAPVGPDPDGSESRPGESHDRHPGEHARLSWQNHLRRLAVRRQRH